jgi:hypothetical protein
MGLTATELSPKTKALALSNQAQSTCKSQEVQIKNPEHAKPAITPLSASSLKQQLYDFFPGR